MSESKKISSKNLGRGPMAIIGLVVAFAIALLVNYLVGMFSFKADLTENNIHTLSKGTKNILSKLDTPVTIRYYVSSDRGSLGPSEKAMVRRVEDLLNEYISYAPTKEVELPDRETGEFEKQNIRMLTVKKFNPSPDTDAEDSARADGLQQGMSGETRSDIFFGIAVECLDKKETIPFIPARPEVMLEYDLSRAIANVHGEKNKKIAVMTSMSVGGGFAGNFQAPPKQPWIFYEQLSQDYIVETIPPTVSEIPAGTTTLIVLHPYDITEEGQYAIDQYLLGGGSVMAFVDPSFFYARAMAPASPQMPGMPPQGGGGPGPSSDLDKLLPKWGISFDNTKVVADLDFASQIIRQGNFSPVFLTLNKQSLGNPDAPDNVTNNLNRLNVLASGGFQIAAVDGIEATTLIQSSEVNEYIEAANADPTAEGNTDSIRKNFKPSGTPRALVVRLSGNFNTAFPEGNPAAAKEEEEKAKAPDGEKGKGKGEEAPKEEKKDDSLKKSTAPGRVMLFADTDFIYDDNVGQRSNFPGMGTILQLMNENLTLVQNGVEQLSGDADLLEVRSRSSVSRPFTRQSQWKREAEDKYKEEISKFVKERDEAEARVQEILSQTPGGVEKAILSPEIQQEMEKVEKNRRDTAKRIRELQKQEKQELTRRQAAFKFGNALLMPILIILFGIGLAVFRKTRTAAR